MIKKFTQKLNLFYLFLIFLLEPIKLVTIPFDGQGRILLFFTVVVFVRNFQVNKNFLKLFVFSKPTVFWVVLMMYSAINLFFKGNSFTDTPFIPLVVILLFMPLMAMIVVHVEVLRDYKKTITFLFYLFIAFAGLFLFISYQNLLNPSIDRKEIMGSFGNTGPLVMMYLVFLGGLQYVQNKIKLYHLALIFVFVVFIIATVSTRKAFVSVIIFVAFIYLSKNKFNRYFLMKTIFVSVLAIVVLNTFIKGSALGVRFEEGLQQGQELNKTDYQFVGLLGDRAYFYNQVGVVSENLLTGIGLRNFPKYTETRLNLHSEYLSHLIENGLIGFFIFILFYISFFKFIRKKFKFKSTELKPLFIVACSAYFVLVFVNFTAWTYSFVHYFIGFGVILGLGDRIKIESNNNLYERK